MKSAEYFKVNEIQVSALNTLCDIVNDWAEKKGWNEGEDSVQRKSSDIALMHSELSECLEFVRNAIRCPNCGSTKTEIFEFRGQKSLWSCQGNCLKKGNGNTFVAPEAIMDDHVPELTGEEAEMADLIIRAFHYCGRRKINLGKAVQLKHEYNTNRPYRHGKNL